MIEDYNVHYLCGEIKQQNIEEAIKFIIEANKLEQFDSDLSLIINSSGGESPQAFALIDIMNSSKISINTYGIGEICSAALFILMNGDTRHITRNTSIMSHQFEWASEGKHSDIRADCVEWTNVENRIISHYKKCTGLHKREIKRHLLKHTDVWLTAQQALDYNLVDKIVTKLNII